MKYFLVEEDIRNRIPYGININRELDIRKIHTGYYHKIPSTNVIEFNIKNEMIFPDILSCPLYLISKLCLEVLEFYEPDLTYKLIYLLNKKSKVNRVYYMPALYEADCLSKKSVFNNNRSKIKQVVIDRDRIPDIHIFRVAGFDDPYVIMRLDLVESLFRRGLKGVRITEVNAV